MSSFLPPCVSRIQKRFQVLLNHSPNSSSTAPELSNNTLTASYETVDQQLLPVVFSVVFTGLALV